MRRTTILAGATLVVLAAILLARADVCTVGCGLGLLPDGSVTTPKIADDAVSKAKIAPDVCGSGLVQDADGSCKANVDGTTVVINGSNQLQSQSAGIDLRDEGVSQGSVTSLDCTGAGVTCTQAAGAGTLTVAGGGGTFIGTTLNSSGFFPSINNSVWIPVEWHNEEFDTDAMHDLTCTGVPTNDPCAEITTTTAGKYLFSCTINWTANGTGQRLLRLTKNVTSAISQIGIGGTPSNSPGLNMSRLVDAAAGDVWKCEVFQNSGAALTITGWASNFSAHKVD